jgi:hypothetical protein
MPRTLRRRSVSWGALAGAAGALLAATALSGCPGELDPAIMMQHGTGGTSGGTGGTSGGTGGSSADCSGSNAGDQVIASTCATSGCHNNSAPLNAGLDLTNDSGLAGRLVGVKSSGGLISQCGGNTTPYLNKSSNPATGLLIDKIKSNPPCGVQMPEGQTPLSATVVQCIVQWATTLTTATP